MIASSNGRSRIHIFFTGSQRLGCPLIEKRFFERLASEDTSQQPHPALVHAMLLVGQAFTLWTPGYSTAQKHDLPTTTPSPKVLLAKTQAYLTDSLSNVDRMLDYLQASILLSYYFFQSGRLEEGQVISAANSGMTVVCKLNMVDQSVLDEMRPGNTPAAGHSFWDGSLLGRPADSYELGVRLWTFWQVRLGVKVGRLWLTFFFSLGTTMPSSASCPARHSSEILSCLPPSFRGRVLHSIRYA